MNYLRRIFCKLFPDKTENTQDTPIEEEQTIFDVFIYHEPAQIVVQRDIYGGEGVDIFLHYSHRGHGYVVLLRSFDDTEDYEYNLARANELVRLIQEKYEE